MTNSQRMWVGVGLAAMLALGYVLRTVIEPFLVAILLAYLGNPLVYRLQRLKLPRTLAVVVVFGLMVAAVIVSLAFLIPLLEKQFALFASKLPALIDYIQNIGIPWLNQALATLGIEPNVPSTASVKDALSEHWQDLGGYASAFWKTLSQSSAAVASWIVNLLLIPVVTFYLLRDWPTLIANLKQLLPPSKASTIIRLLSQCDEVVGAFFKGQLLVMLALGLMYVLGLSLVGLQLAVLIGLGAGLLSIVPYLGFSLGLVCAILAAAVQFQDTLHILYVVIVFAVGNGLEGMVLTPWLVGDKIGLHPVAVIFAILAGGELFGFIGILLALPAAAMLMVFLRHLRHYYLQGQWYY